MSNIMKKTYPSSKFVKIKFDNKYARENIDFNSYTVLQLIPLNEHEVVAEVIDTQTYLKDIAKD